MSKHQIKTDNSFLELKIKLRIDNLPAKQKINILDVYHGQGIIWSKIINQNSKHIAILGMDQKTYNGIIQLRGDNVKFLKKMDLSVYDIIDLDAYGIPFKQLETIFQNRSLQKGTIFFITFIQKYHGAVQYKLLNYYGYTKKMIEKIPTLFYKNGFDKFKHYLAFKGIRHIKYYEVDNKYYATFINNS